MADLEIALDARSFLSSLRLARGEFEKAAARALTRSVFEIRDAERREIESLFEFAGGSTRKFLSGPTAFAVKAATPDRLVAEVAARRGTAGILSRHQRGGIFGPGDDTLTADHRVAIPASGLRGASGRVPKRMTPAEVRKAKRGFVRGQAVFLRTGGRGKRGLRLLFTLTPRFKLRPRYDFHRIARDVALRVFPAKLRSEIAKVKVR